MAANGKIAVVTQNRVRALAAPETATTSGFVLDWGSRTSNLYFYYKIYI